MANKQGRRSAVPMSMTGRSGFALPFQGSSFSKSAPVTPKSKGGGTTVHDPGAHLTGATAATYATLKEHDTARGTACAPAYVDYIDAAQLQYEDDMRGASLQSSKGIALPGKSNAPSPRDVAETMALAAKAQAHATALKWASDCMQGEVEPEPEPEPEPDPEPEPTVSSGRNVYSIAGGAAAALPSGLLADIAKAAEADQLDTEMEIIDGADVMQQQQMMVQQQQAMDMALAEQQGIDAAAKRNKLILYAVLGLGAAGVVFYFIRRKA